MRQLEIVPEAVTTQIVGFYDSRGLFGALITTFVETVIVIVTISSQTERKTLRNMRERRDKIFSRFAENNG